MRGMATILEREQQPEEAEQLLKQAIDLQPGNWQSVDALGRLYFVNGRYADAAHAFRQVVFLDTNNWIGHGNLGSALMMTGDFDAAVDPLNTALSIQKDAYFLSNLGIIYYYLGEYDRSVNIHRESMEEMPNSASVWVNLGDALLFSSRPDEAVDAYRMAMKYAAEQLAVSPNSPDSLYRQAWATAASGNPEQATFFIDKALTLAPNNPYVRYYDGLIKHSRGEKSAAIDALQLAVEMGYPVRMLAADPLMLDLRGENRFIDIVGNVGKQATN